MEYVVGHRQQRNMPSTITKVYRFVATHTTTGLNLRSVALLASVAGTEFARYGKYSDLPRRAFFIYRDELFLPAAVNRFTVAGA